MKTGDQQSNMAGRKIRVELKAGRYWHGQSEAKTVQVVSRELCPMFFLTATRGFIFGWYDAV